LGERGKLTSKRNRSKVLQLIEEAINNGARKEKACNLLSISIRTLQRWNNCLIDKRTKRKFKAVNRLTNAEKENIIKICCSSRFQDLTPNTIVPILAEEGTYLASESSFYRILKEANLLKHRSRSKRPKQSENDDKKATKINELWSWDITYLKTNIKGKFYYLYLFMDLWSRKITGWQVYTEENGNNSSSLIKKICEENSIEKEKLKLHSDNGGPMKCATMLATLQHLGITSSFSRPSVSNDNAYSESLFKTLKYTAGYPKQFNTLDKANEWVNLFVKWYNNEHRHSKIGFVTPQQRHSGKDIEILKERENTYKKARNKHPERWTKNTRKWEHKKVIVLKKGNYKNVS
jgi:transposase InsO family protein